MRAERNFNKGIVSKVEGEGEGGNGWGVDSRFRGSDGGWDREAVSGPALRPSKGNGNGGGVDSRFRGSDGGWDREAVSGPALRPSKGPSTSSGPSSSLRMIGRKGILRGRRRTDRGTQRTDAGRETPAFAGVTGYARTETGRGDWSINDGQYRTWL